MTLEYELMDANGVCQGIQKVRVEPATRSAVATWYKNKKTFFFYEKFVTNGQKAT